MRNDLPMTVSPTAPRFTELRHRFMEAGRYLVTGGAAYVLDTGLYALMLSLGAHYLTAATVGFLAGLTLAYALSVRWVFDARRLVHKGAEFLLFFLTGVFGLLLTAAILWGLIEHAHLHPLVAKACAAAVVLVSNFTLRKKLIFSPPARAEHITN